MSADNFTFNFWLIFLHEDITKKELFLIIYRYVSYVNSFISGKRSILQNALENVRSWSKIGQSWYLIFLDCRMSSLFNLVQTLFSLQKKYKI
jgi:hypothetical protein